MSYIQCTPEQPQLIAVNRLEKSPLNARRTHVKMGMEELKASLLSHGLMQNLVVTDKGDGTYRVIAGGRRLEAIQSLQAEGKLPGDFAVPCQIVAEDHALEMSLAENAVRLDMHPADQYVAFAALIEQGHSAAEVANRFGIEENLVLKRMKLARVAPQLLEEYRNQEMTLECLMAYTISDDHRRQLKVFKSLPKWDKDDPNAIRAALTEKMVESSDKVAQFVGLDAYQAAGGAVRADLFGTEVFLEQPALVRKLAEEKLSGIRKELEAEGWGWVEINPERDYDAIHRCGRIKPRLIGVPDELVAIKTQLDAELEAIEETLVESVSDEQLDTQQAVHDRLEEVERKLAAYVGYDSTQKALAGCFVSIGQDGSLFLDKGLVKPEHRRLLAKLLGTEGTEEKPAKAKTGNGLSESLCRDLSADRVQVAKVEIARHPAIALDLLAFRAASELLGDDEPSDGPSVEFTLPKPGKNREPSKADAELDAIKKVLPIGWLKANTEAARFDAFCSLPEGSRLDLLAFCVALTLQPKLAPAHPDEATAYDAALSRTAGQVASYWRPTKGNFLGRLTRDQLLAVGREVLGEQWSQSRSNVKKSALVEQLDRAFSDPDKSGRTPGQIDKLKQWLPSGMSFGPAKTAKPVKAKKGRKAA
jgi:ParB family chromosome partitioning protein